MDIVPKRWGYEFILLNYEVYGAKILVVEEGAVSSLHRHPIKDEAMVCLSGHVLLEVEGECYDLSPRAEPVRIRPGEWHRFTGIERSQILEVSTHDSPDDVERLTHSRAPGETVEEENVSLTWHWDDGCFDEEEGVKEAQEVQDFIDGR